MKIDRKKFFDGIRDSIHRGSMTQEQVASYDAIFDAAEAYPVVDVRHLAYIFATTRGEVGSGMQPVREIGKGKGRPYGKPDPKSGQTYYGRGFVQLTWADNYRSLGKRIGVDLYNNPDLALDRTIAARVLVIGMMEGLFTGKRLSDYIVKTMTNFEDARRIINGTDRAAEFATIARKYHTALAAAMLAGSPDPTPAPAPQPAPAPEPEPPQTEAPKPKVTAVQVIIGLVAAAITFVFGWIFAGGSN